MPIPVRVQDVVEALDLQLDETLSYLNRQTGELFSWNQEWGSVEDEDEDLSRYPDWQREAMVQYREVCDSDDWLPLPSNFDIHEWDIMSRYCETVEPERKRESLRNAIRGRGAFRRFKDAATRLGVIDDWYEYRGRALEEIAIDWLEENAIPYTSEKRRPTSA
jgi:hypothetical protein